MMSRHCSFALYLLLVPASAILAQDSASKDPWENLSHVTHRPSYDFVDRHFNCLTGEILSVMQNNVTLKRWETKAGNHPSSTTITLDRKDVVRVIDGVQAIDVIYSAR